MQKTFGKFLIGILLFTILFGASGTQAVYAASFTASDAATLIAAINTANSNSQDDTITLTANITLTAINNGLNGLPVVGADSTHTLTIEGAGFTLTRSSASDFRFLEVAPGANLTVNNLTISNGQVSAAAAIYNNNGTLTITNSTFTNNTATSAVGGAIQNGSGTLTVSNSTFTGNSATTNGGAITSSGVTSVFNSTFYNNTATTSGGGIFSNGASANLTVKNSTFSGNTAAATSGAGIHNNGTAGFTLYNTILANSMTGKDCYNSSGVSPSGTGSNLIETQGDGSTAITNCQTGALSTDPNLAALANNGGLTQTMALASPSDAINGGNNTICDDNPGPNNLDQRGVPRPQGVNCDIGAFEAYPTGTVLYAKPTATGNGNCLSWANACSLQTALSFAASGNQIWVMAGKHIPGTARQDSFTLKLGVAVYGGFAGTETLLTQRNIANNVTILSGDIDNNDTNADSNNIAETTTAIQGNNSYHVVIGSGTDSTAILDGFTVTAGQANGPGANEGNGGGMFNDFSNPTISNATFSGNSASSGGGGMSNNNSSPTISNATFSGNSASNGGGMYNSGGSPTISNATFSGNSAFNGGGMYNDYSNPTISNATFSGNSASNGGGMFNLVGSPSISNATFSGNSANEGGGMFNAFNDSSGPTLKNTIIANSTSGGDCRLGFLGSINAASSHNLIESTGSDACDLTASFGGGSNIIGSDPTLGSLTGSPAYFPLNAGSLAINNGSNASCAAAPVNNQSQNGVTRPKGSACDIGSFEYSPLPTSPTFGDVPMNHPYWADIEILYANGFTGGCSTSPLLFCPETTMDRAQGAVFMLRGLVGTSYVPPVEPFANPFGDSWAPGPWAQRWAQGMLDQGLTAGCSTSPLLYCPWEQMPRAQAAVFGMRLLNGSAYLPPAGTGTVFADVNGSEWYAGWAEQAYLNGLLPACGTSGGLPLFCPNNLVSRGLGAYMIVRARNLSMP